jgi:hypothetical protein
MRKILHQGLSQTKVRGDQQLPKLAYHQKKSQGVGTWKLLRTYPHSMND